MKRGSILALMALAGALFFTPVASASSPHGVASIVAATGTAKQNRDLSYYGAMKVHWQATCPPAPAGGPLLWFVLYRVTTAQGKAAHGITGGAVSGQQSIVGRPTESGTFLWYVVLDKGSAQETFHATLTLVCSGKHIPLVGKPAFTLSR